MGDRPGYDELVEMVGLLENRLDSLINDNIQIRKDTASSTPTSLDNGTAVLTSTGLNFGVSGGVLTLGS